MSRFSVENFLSHSTETFRRGTHLCLRKILVSKIFVHKRGRCVTVLRRIFWSHSTEKFRRGTLQCFRKFLVSKHVKYKRGGGYHDLASKLFCLTQAKSFVGGTPLCFKRFLISKNFMDKKAGEKGSITIFRQKFFFRTVAKNLVGEPLFFTNLGYRKILCKGKGMSRFSVEKFLSQYRNISQRNPSEFQKKSGFETSHG